MTQYLDYIRAIISNPLTIKIIQAIFIFIGGFVGSRLLIAILPVSRLQLQHQFVIKRLVRYSIIVLAFTLALQRVGVSLGVLLGAAGILTVALGFAAQTSASNLISGLFLMAEQPFKVGSIIQVSDIVGTVISIELLSVRLKTFDNIQVRIPNETMLKSNLSNLTKYPLRRYDLKLGISYRENFDKTKKALLEVAESLPICLDNPKPQVYFLGFGESAINLQFSVWTVNHNWMELKYKLGEEVKKKLDKENIEIALPHLSLYAGSNTLPIPVELINKSTTDK
ncbi:MAG: mechanosensitive ion channel family protein [Deltaproteobacteria bacterium]|jgi:small-conductance mechanosensitive channel|nr:mechanosensitive ion channel family protein [Deltaproteobacteria bacterium]